MGYYDKPLSMILIEQVFSFMEPLGFKTYEIPLEGVQWNTLQTLAANCGHKEISFPKEPEEVFNSNVLEFKKDKLTLTFINASSLGESKSAS